MRPVVACATEVVSIMAALCSIYGHHGAVVLDAFYVVLFWVIQLVPCCWLVLRVAYMSRHWVLVGIFWGNLLLSAALLMSRLVRLCFSL
jgi:hypothetical protein